jgi:subtilase family serine protease
MLYQIRNSNQFASWVPGAYLTPSDYLEGTPGNNLSTTQSNPPANRFTFTNLFTPTASILEAGNEPLEIFGTNDTSPPLPKRRPSIFANQGIQGSRDQDKNSPDSQKRPLTDETKINVQFILRRNTFETTEKPEGFIESNELLNLPYRQQASFINNLSAEDIRSWYGASAGDLAAVTNYLLKNNATIVEANQEQRSVKATLTLGDFKSAFLAGRTDINFSEGVEDMLYYYNPGNFADSYLTARGSDGESFARAVIGSRISRIVSSTPPEITPSPQENNTLNGISSFAYYPLEVAAQYNYPDQAKTNGGKGIGLGIVGTGGDQFNKYFNINNALINYLGAQGINTEDLGQFFSDNTPVDPKVADIYGEPSLDLSIARSVAPKSDIYMSSNSGDSKLYGSFAELIYNKSIDIISSSSEFGQDPGTFNLTEALNELFIDALLRGKTIVQASGDVGSSDNHKYLPKGSTIPSPSESPAVLSVGGTALNKNAQALTSPRNEITLPTALPPSFSPGIVDNLTGLISNQYAWKATTFAPLTEEDRLDAIVYPTVSNQFTSKDFIGSTLFPGAFDNLIGSSGVQYSSVLPMPSYQTENLSTQWLGTGRRYPDVSALAGSNAQQESTSYYYILEVVPNDAQTDFVPEAAIAGGTSAATPLVAGLLANLLSFMRERFGQSLKFGMINTLLYEAYNSENKDRVFFDIPAGTDNANVFTVATNPDDWSGYTLIYQDETSKQKYLIPVNGTGPGRQLDTNLSSTGIGFDAATGIGSINGEGLLDQLVSVFSEL